MSLIAWQQAFGSMPSDIISWRHKKIHWRYDEITARLKKINWRHLEIHWRQKKIYTRLPKTQIRLKQTEFKTLLEKLLSAQALTSYIRPRMSKKVLVLYYSQTGQLKDIVDSFLVPFSGTDVSVEVVRVKPQNDFSFPWNSDVFFNAMPETVLAIPVPLEKFQLREQKYDLIVFAYQPWYLSLSIPANSILATDEVKKVLKDTPVLTLIGARNMWISSQEKLKRILSEAGANLVGNIALVDRNPNLISAATIIRWLMYGDKGPWKFFPASGVSAEDIAHTAVFGKTVSEYLQRGNFEGMQQALVNQNAVDVKPNLVFIEERAPKLFSIWANIIIKRKNRKLWITIFQYYLLFALFIIAPIVLTINAVFFRPFFGKSVREKQLYYSGLK